LFLKRSAVRPFLNETVRCQLYDVDYMGGILRKSTLYVSLLTENEIRLLERAGIQSDL